MTKSAKKRAKSVEIAKSKPLTHSEELKLQRQADEALKQTLQYLQDRVKRQPELYRNEFDKHWVVFKAKLAAFKQSPGKCDPQLNYYLLFFAHISQKYKADIVEPLSTECMAALEQYYSVLNPLTRLTFVTALKILRGKDLVQPVVVLPIFFKLFKCKDKELRKFLHQGLVSDLKRLNQEGKANQVNRRL